LNHPIFFFGKQVADTALSSR